MAVMRDRAQHVCAYCAVRVHWRWVGEQSQDYAWEIGDGKQPEG